MGEPGSFASSEVAIGSGSSPPSKKARGRPLGSKNKLKLPFMVNQDNEPDLKPIFIQVPKNSDVIEAVTQFARRCQVSITVQSASGSILKATLFETNSRASPFIVHGSYTLISFTGTYINNNPFVVDSSSSSSNLDLQCSFMISFGSILGQSFTGTVAGKVIAGDDVTVVVTILKAL